MSDKLYTETLVYTDAAGNKKRKYFRAKTKAGAKRKLMEFQAQTPAGESFSVVADMWWEEHSNAVSYNTAQCYVKPLADVKEWFDGENITDITPKDIQREINAYALAGAKLKPRAKHTVQLRLNVLSLIFKYAMFNRLVSFNPVTGIQIPAVNKTAKRMPPNAAQNDSIKDLKTEGFNLLPILLMYTGMRRCEALALSWSDFNFADNTIKIDKIIEYHGNTPVLRKGAKSEAGSRILPMIPQLAEIMQANASDGPLFAGKDGFLTKGEFTHRWNSLHLGITCHQLRHNFATKSYEAGIDAETAQLLLGVSSVRVVTDIYRHIEAEKKVAESAAKLSQIL